MKFTEITRWNILAGVVIVGVLILISMLAGCAPQKDDKASIQNPVEPSPVDPTIPATATKAPTAAFEPSATPDQGGPQIVFVSNRSGDQDSRQLHILDLDSGEIHLLDTGFDNVVFPRWSPDGQKILFTVTDVWNLYTIRSDGSELTQVTDFRSNNADWSPNGTGIVFQSDHAGEPENTPDIYTMNLDGSGLTKIVDDLPIADFGPRWSKDGNQITFLSTKTGHPEVYLIDPDGSNRTQVTDGGSTIISQEISPDGSLIVFSYPQGKVFTDLYTVDISGVVDSVVRLTSDASLKDAPAWTPDGQKIVYFGNKGGPFDIWIINKDGSSELNLTADEFYDGYPDYWAP
ncbi:MAG: hypothetical protein AB9891_19685 [Anaerolineaceae bacterium]